jgi:hypothetical protein
VIIIDSWRPLTILIISVYSNSLLATLNARKKIRAAADGIHNTSDNLSLSLREFPRNGGISMATKVSFFPLSSSFKRAFPWTNFLISLVTSYNEKSAIVTHLVVLLLIHLLPS